MDEVEVYQTINGLYAKVKELDDPNLRDIFSRMLDVINSSHERIDFLTSDEDE